MTSYECLDMAAHAGVLLLQSGGEVRRVSKTMEHILNHCGYHDYHIFVISNGIFATLNEGSEDRCHVVRRVTMKPMNLDIVIRVNEISRQLTSSALTPEEAYKAFYAVDDNRVPHEKELLILASGVSGAAFTAILGGGNVSEIVTALFLGAILQVILSLFPDSTPKFLADIMGSFCISSIIALLCHTFMPLRMSALIPGVIIVMVPGVAFTTSIRDFLQGDFLSGVIHLADALLTAIGICVGIGMALAFTGGIL